jgi:type IV secretory pathway TrbL component
MKPVILLTGVLLIGAPLAAIAQDQSTTPTNTSTDQSSKNHNSKSKNKNKPGPGREAANGVGDAGKGVAKGTGDLVTLHPVKAAGAVGKGAGEGTYKVSKGVGGGIAKIFHHPHIDKNNNNQ